MATKKAPALPDPEALAGQLDQLAAAMLDFSVNAGGPDANAHRRTIGAVDGPVRAAAQALHDHGQALADALGASSGGYTEPDTDS
jgi:hypothetical protein